MQPAVKVAIVMPVYNRRETTLQCLRSLHHLDSNGLQIKIYIVDDGSTDRTSEAVSSQFPEVQVVPGDGSLHYAAGTNRGIEAALNWQPDYFVLMNDDAIVDPDLFQSLVDTAKTNPHSIVGALLLLWNNPHEVFQVGQKWVTLRGGWQMPAGLSAFDMPREPFEVECLVGNCVLVPADAVRECGLMDEIRFPHGWGDAQYFMRMRRAGWRLLVDPRARIWCEPNTYPPPLHTLAIKEVLRVLFVNQRHPANLRRQFVAMKESAPTKPQGVAAFLVYCVQFMGKTVRKAAGKLSAGG